MPSLHGPGRIQKEIQRLLGWKVPRFQDSKVARFRGSRVLSLLSSRVPKLDGSTVPRFQEFEVAWMAARLYCCKVAGFQGPP